MAGSALPNYNKPLFAASVIFVANTTDIAATTDIHADLSNVYSIYTVVDDNGCIIERVTVTTSPNNGETPSNQLIFLCVKDPINNKWIILKSSVLTGVAADDTVATPSVQFTFTGGILLTKDSQIGIARTQNNGSYDNLHVVLEGGGFDEITA